MSKTVEETYQKLTQREHVLRRPGMYIGTVDNITDPIWVYNSESNRMEEKILNYNPGIVKLFDEIITNAADHARDYPDKVTDIKVVIDQKRGSFSVCNNGPGIPIVKHSEHNLWIPEMIFANFLSGSNYNDDEKRLKGGCNGLGAKLTGVFSKEFIIETCADGKRYKQSYTKNLSVIGREKITKNSKNDYTKITFFPDWSKFGLSEMTESIIKACERRVYDIAACTKKDCNVSLNGKRVKAKDFESYINLFVGPKKTAPRVIVQKERWKIAFLLNPFDKFTQISFVNGLHTAEGGTHVEHVVGPLVRKVTEQLKEKYKDFAESIKTNYVRDNLMVFVFALIENPEFESQNKEKLTTRSVKFGSRCSIEESVIKQVVKLGIADNVLAIANARTRKEMAATDGKKKIKLTGIPKLDDANKAGGRDAIRCTLIVTEGDSAKTFAVSGLPKLPGGRDYYGIYPLKGKCLNVREATNQQLLNNKEFIALRQILGLSVSRGQTGLDKIRKEMRYGRILILTDQDHDGSHIKGLLINFFHFFWPELVKENFITCLQTPIIKANKGVKTKVFFNIPEYTQWKKSHQRGWKIKYYKGLGTSSSKEAKDSFENIGEKLVSIKVESDYDEECILLAFKKTFSGARKTWIQKATGKSLFLDPAIKQVPVSKFVNEELVLFSIADCIRSIPNLMDGFKPSQRKVLYGCLLKGITDEIKVDQIRGFIGEKSAYHHGDASLNETIISMNHDFVGSNNLNFLSPCGQLGTRLMGGKDAASPRYISTKLNPLTRYLFPAVDDQLLKYLDDDGFRVEPEYYVPIIPTILLNGTKGVGTGYSTSIPNYNITDIINNIRKLIIDEDSDIDELIPWYKGFKGTIEKNGENDSFITKGKWRQLNTHTIQITELPIKVWTQDYKNRLDKWIESGKINAFRDRTTETEINLEIVLSRIELAKWLNNGTLEKELSLTSVLQVGNMHVFNHKKKLIKVSGPEEILYYFWQVRGKLYQKRYSFLLDSLKKRVEMLSAKIAFLIGVMEGTIKVFRIPKKTVIARLVELSFPKFDGSYSFLIGMPISSFTEEELQKLQRENDKLNKEIELLGKKTYKDLWLEDLTALESALRS